MDEADVCLLLIDATQGITTQDVSIFALAARKGKGIVVLVNKWDLMEKENSSGAWNCARQKFEEIRLKYKNELTREDWKSLRQKF